MEPKLKTEIWHERDKNGNVIHIKWSDGTEVWYERDKNGNIIHEKWFNGLKIR